MTIATEENCLPTPKLAPNQTLTLTGGQFLSGAIVSLPHNPKTNPNLDPNPNPNRGANFLRGVGVGGSCPDTLYRCSYKKVFWQ